MDKEKELNSLKRLVDECIVEQKSIGLHPVVNNVFFNYDPESRIKIGNKLGATICNIKTNSITLIFKRTYFDKIPSNVKKELIHHELIHANLQDGKTISHITNWREFSKISKKIKEAYEIDPLVTYTSDCFANDKQIRYNRFINCPNCGSKKYFYHETGSGKWGSKTTKCNNCGMVVEIIDNGQ